MDGQTRSICKLKDKVMQKDKHWYLISYDIRDPKRWKKVYQLLQGCGEHIQYSIFRVYMNQTQLQKNRWRLEEILSKEDDILIVRLCQGCSNRVIDSRSPNIWKQTPKKFEII